MNSRELRQIGVYGLDRDSYGIDIVTAATADYNIYCTRVPAPSYLIEADGTVVLDPCSA